MPFEKHLNYHGKQTLQGEEYFTFFLSSGNPADPQGDQYRLYLSTDNLRIRFIQLTLRDLADSYSGWIHYSNYESIEGIRIPFQISIQDSPSLDSNEYVHRIELQYAVFSRE